MRNKLLRLLARVLYRYPRTAVLLILLSAIVAAFLVSRLELQADLMDLLPADSPSVQAYFDTLESFGLSDYLVVFLDSPEPLDVAVIAPAMEQLGLLLDQSPLTGYVEYKFSLARSREVELLLLRYLPLFVPVDRLPLFYDRLTPDGMQLQMRRQRKILLSESSFTLSQFIEHDPLGLLIDFSRGLTGSSGQFNLDISDEYFFSQDRTKAFLLIKPVHPPQNIQYNKQLKELISSSIAAVKQNHPEINDIPIEATGTHIIAYEESQLVRRDIIMTAVTSLIAILALFWIAFKRLSSLLFVGPPLVVGVLWALGLGYLLIGHLNLITSICSAVVMGLGIDFGIHIYNRYLDEVTAGKDPALALELTLGFTGKGIMTGALTTAVAFYAMMLTDFAGIAEFGFMTGTGILMCLAAMCTLLPALLAWEAKSPRWQTKYHRLTHFGLEHLVFPALKRPRITLLIGAVITAAACAMLPQVNFNDNLRALRTRSNRALNVYDKVGKLMGSTLKPLILSGTAPDEQELQRRITAVAQALQPLTHDGTLAWVDSLGRYLPPLDNQQEALDELIRRNTDGLAEETSFRDIITSNGFRWQDSYSGYLTAVRESLSLRQTLPVAEVMSGPLGILASRFINLEDGELRYALYLYPKEDLHEREAADRVLTAVNRALEPLSAYQCTLTGTNLLTLELKSLIKESLWSVTGWLFASVVLMLLLHYRSLTLTVVTLLPVAIGMTWMFGFLPLIGMDLNYLNTFVIPMVIGIGVDNSIHFLERFRELKGTRRTETAVLGLGKAIVMTSLTTVAGFGSLAFANHSGISSLGIICSLGVLACMSTSLFILPAATAALELRRQKTAPAKQGH